MDDPNLLPTGVDPQSPEALRVTPLSTLTPPEPIVDTKIEHHYMCSLLNASIHRKDGTRLGFVHGHFVTSLKADIAFLENEIDNGHPYITRATSTQIREASLKKNPMGTLRKEIEAELRGTLETQIRAELEAKMSGVVQVQTSDKVVYPQGQTIDLDKGPIEKLTDEVKLSGTSSLASLRERVRSGTATLQMQNKPMMPQVPPISPVSTQDIKDGAAG